MSAHYPPEFGKKHESKTPAGQIVEDAVDSLTLGTLGGTAGNIVDKFFDNNDDDSD